MKNKYQIVFYSVIALLIAVAIVTAFVCSGYKNIFVSTDEYAAKSFKIDVKTQTYTVYIDGAVSFSGFYSYKKGDTYRNLLQKAGLLDCSVFKFGGATLDSVVDTKEKTILVVYKENEEIMYPVNVNSALFAVLAKESKIQQNTIDKIAEYIATNGKIQTKTVLKSVLTDQEWQAVFFKLYVGE